MTFAQTFRSQTVLTGLCAAALAASLGACAHKRPSEGPMATSGPPPGSDRGGYDRDRPSTAGSGSVSSNPYGGAYRPGSAEEFAANDKDRVFFEYDQYTITGDGRAVLDAQAAWLARYPRVQIRVEGNADERGTREYNQALAGRRASAVRQYLSERGVNPARMSEISYGKERPIDTSGTEAGMARNRNAHTAVVSGAS